jgi:hypothetical protein
VAGSREEYGPKNVRASWVDSLPLLSGREFAETLRDLDLGTLNVLASHEPGKCSFCDDVRTEVQGRKEEGDGAETNLGRGTRQGRSGGRVGFRPASGK